MCSWPLLHPRHSTCSGRMRTLTMSGLTTSSCPTARKSSLVNQCFLTFLSSSGLRRDVDNGEQNFRDESSCYRRNFCVHNSSKWNINGYFIISVISHFQFPFVSEIVVNGLATNIPNFIGSDALTYFAFGAEVSSVDLEDDWNYYTYSIDTPVGKKDIKLFSPTVDCERLKVIVRYFPLI